MKLTQVQSARPTPENLEHYFNRRETPAKNSPVGKLMRKIHSRFPHIDLETVRIEARDALLGVAGANRVRVAFHRWLKRGASDKKVGKARFSSAGKALPGEPLTAPIERARERASLPQAAD